MMGPRRKATKTQNLDEGLHDPLIQAEPKDYMNELSHEVLCHIFRSGTKPLTSSLLFQTFQYSSTYSGQALSL